MSALVNLLSLACICASASGVFAAVNKLNVHGLVAAVYTPFNATGHLNLSVVAMQAKFLNASGVRYVLVAGTTGESVSMTEYERKSLLEAWIAMRTQYDIGVIAHVGANCLEESRELAAHAQSVGADAVASMSPSFFKPANIHALIESMKTIADRAPALPFYYYHLPSMTGVEFSMYDFLVQGSARIPNLVGIKYTGLYENLAFPDVMRIMAYNDGQFEVMTGRDEMIFQCLATGVVGFVGSQYNFAGEAYNALIDAYHAGQIQDAWQQQLSLINLLFVEFNVSQGMNGNKYMMNIAGVPVGDSRIPFLRMDEQSQTKEYANTQQWCQGSNRHTKWCADIV